jgi:hypothetical protein
MSAIISRGPVNLKKKSVILNEDGKNNSEIAILIMLCNAAFTVSLPPIVIYKILQFLPKVYTYYTVSLSSIYVNRWSPPVTIDEDGNLWTPCIMFGTFSYDPNYKCWENKLCIYSPDDSVENVSYDPDSDDNISKIICYRCKNDIAQKEYEKNAVRAIYSSSGDGFCSECGYFRKGRTSCSFCRENLINF